MKLYHVIYSGVWLGGKAVVLAKSRKGALRQVREHSKTVGPENMEVKEVFGLDKPVVVYNDNGDY